MLTHKWLMGVVGTVLFSGTITNAAIMDDFNDNSINPQLWVRYPYPGIIENPNWVSYSDGTGVVTSETNQRVEISIPADVFSSTHIFGGALHSQRKVRGDFDLQVDYDLLSWPNASGARSALAIWDEVSGYHATVERSSFGPSATDYPGWPRDNYVGPMVDPLNGVVAQGIVATNDRSGKLRFSRVGNELTSYYFGQGQWLLLSTAKAPTADMDFAIAAWSADYFFSGQDVSVAFDNMSGTGIVEPATVPEPASLAIWGCIGIAGVFGARRRKRAQLA